MTEATPSEAYIEHERMLTRIEGGMCLRWCLLGRVRTGYDKVTFLATFEANRRTIPTVIISDGLWNLTRQDPSRTRHGECAVLLFS